MKSGLIAIVGRPNAGKSTLVNALMESDLSIVSPKPQTTRDQIQLVYNDPKIGQIVFIDTPGLHRAKSGGINESMVFQASLALEDPDLVWYLFDPTSKIEHEEIVLEKICLAKKPVLLLANKSDWAQKKHPVETSQKILAAQLEERLRTDGLLIATIYISGLKGIEVDAVLKKSWEQLKESPFLYPDVEQMSNRNTRYFVGELIREQLFLQTGEEIPYSCAVKVESYKSGPDRDDIQATIVVERESQKGMVIGQKGIKIKNLGIKAREKIEALIEKKVFLGLKVSVDTNWTKKSDSLKALGYVLPK